MYTHLEKSTAHAKIFSTSISRRLLIWYNLASLPINSFMILILETSMLPGSLISCCVAVSVFLWMGNVLTWGWHTQDRPRVVVSLPFYTSCTLTVVEVYKQMGVYTYIWWWQCLTFTTAGKAGWCWSYEVYSLPKKLLPRFTVSYTTRGHCFFMSRQMSKDVSRYPETHQWIMTGDIS